MLDAILNLIFPPKCPACGKYVESNGAWCEACLDKSLRLHQLPLSPDMTKIFSGGVWCFGLYEGVLKKLIASMKFDKKSSAVKQLQFFTGCGVKQIDLSAINLAVPVPLHITKEKQRGFNQTTLLFSKALQSNDISFKECLQRQRETVPQFGLSREERIKNVKGAFSLADDRVMSDIYGKNILLVDDIFTTGATFVECGKVLKKAGAKCLWGLVVASGRK
ncbi:ComF family protein [uncultured Anaerovibrio sp.]|uniref:ComF family protein n=1 Tax=uncultured Anaerovibrio sp. TaxID=361586 RepID=UPI00262CF295|nr:ComF family protein [uncultured Anaerovibrio sp.]